MSTIGLTVDVVVLVETSDGTYTLVVTRRDDPYRGRLALPGGYVEYGEDLAVAAVRELAEETGLVVDPGTLTQVRAYGHPDRDPRGHVISVAHRVTLPADAMQQVRAGSDAAAAIWMPVDDLLANPDVLAFDHHRILADAIAGTLTLRTRIRRAIARLTGATPRALVAPPGCRDQAGLAA